MAYTVTIKYNGVEEAVPQIADPISAVYAPCGSYIDTPVYREGYPVDAEEADKKYGKSIYATNVCGWGHIDVPEPYATTSVPMSSPLAQFKLAVVGEDNQVDFDVEDYKEAFYYQQLGVQMADQGFEVTVAKK